MAVVLKLVSAALLAATGCGALRCYTCLPDNQIAGVSIPTVIVNKTANFPHCSELDPADPDLKFEMSCPRGLDKSCIKIGDGRGNQMRSCFSVATSRCTKTAKRGQVFCSCRGDFCNTASAAPAGVACLALAVAVGLSHLRHWHLI